MSLSRSDTQVMLHADASRSPARAVVSIQRCDSLSAVARERRCLTAPLSRFQILASARPSTAPLPASSARAACNSTPPSAPPLPTGPNPLARARRPPKTNSLASWTTTISRPATRAAVPLTAWQTISSVVTEPLCRKRRNRISCARLPPSRRIQEPGRTTKAACSAAPLFPGGGRQTAPAQIRPSPIPPRIDHRPTESSLQTGGNKMCAFDSRLRGEVEIQAQLEFRVRGLSASPSLTVCVETPPHPDLLPACGEKEKMEAASLCRVDFTCQRATMHRAQHRLLAAHEVCRDIPSPDQIEGAGSTGCWPHPRALRARKVHLRTQATTGQPKQSGTPCASGLRLIARSPRGTGLVSPRRPGLVTRGLTPASGCQDHTPLPSASAPFAFGAKASIASRTQRSVTTAKRPSEEAGRGGLYACFHISVKQK